MMRETQVETKRRSQDLIGVKLAITFGSNWGLCSPVEDQEHRPEAFVLGMKPKRETEETKSNKRKTFCILKA